MKFFLGFFAVVVLVVAGIFWYGATGLPDAPVIQDGQEQGIWKNNGPATNPELVPDLSFEDYQGNVVALRDLIGKPLVVNSWATWCPFCKKELPDFAQVQEIFGDEVLIVAIDRAESLEQAKAYTDEHGITDKLLYLLDPDDTFYTTISGFSMPETLFVNSEGIIEHHRRGIIDAVELDARIRQLP